MKKFLLTLWVVAACFASASAVSWDNIIASGDYYYGVGVGATVEEADKAAMANLISQIATHVSSDFTQIDDMAAGSNGSLDHKERVLNCVRTYSAATLHNALQFYPEGEGEAPNITMRRYMLKSELGRVFEGRISKAKCLADIAAECISNNQIDLALQNYYWAYSLLRSVQYPNEVKDSQGRVLVEQLRMTIETILRNINVKYISKTDDNLVTLSFTYNNTPVNSLRFNYSDGRGQCTGDAKNGFGTLEMIPDYETSTYHVDVEYQFINQARGDGELESVLQVITPRVFSAAAFKVQANGQVTETPTIAPPASYNPNQNSGINSLSQSANAQPAPNSGAQSSSTIDASAELNILQEIANGLANKDFISLYNYFTPEGRQIFTRLTNYGKARLLDSSNLKVYRGLNGTIVVRGLTMSFAFSGRRKKTFVEEVSFTFNQEHKIENVAFGIGREAEDGIFNRPNASYTPEVCEIMVSFLENYKTAYSLERLDYLRELFADDAVIIVGRVLRRQNSNRPDAVNISANGNDIIQYNQYNKQQYIDHLARSFNRNDYINIQFANHQIQWLNKYQDRPVFAINIRQQYESSIYSDMGYLFLMVDMSDPNAPLIKVRTWQPNEVDINQLYNAGDFY